MSKIKDGTLRPRRAPKQKMTQRKPGLLFPALRVEVETVTARHKAQCIRCTEIPEIQRLKVCKGSGKNAKSEVMCIACGFAWLKDRRREVTRAIKRLATGKGEIRL